MGRSIDKQVERQYKFSPDPLQEERVKKIGQKIAAVCDRKEIDYHFRVLDDPQVNAVSLPGGYIYINSGLLEKVSNDDELACVLAHEVGHIVARHSIKKLQAMQSYSILRLLTAVAPGTARWGERGSRLYPVPLGYSRDDEFACRSIGRALPRLAGYDPNGMVTFLTKLQDIPAGSLISRRLITRPIHTCVQGPGVKEEKGKKMDFDDISTLSRRHTNSLFVPLFLILMPFCAHYAEEPRWERAGT
jgi:predicted Zn-dependent protease